MKIFSRFNPVSGWVVLKLHADGIYMVHVTDTTPPQVQFAHFFPLAQTTVPVLLAQISREHQLKRYHCILLLNDNEYQLSLVEMPNVPKEELKTAVRWVLKDLLDYHVEDATIDVLHIPTDESALGKKPMMYVVSAHNQLIEQRQTWFNDAGIPLKVIDIPDLAQRNIAQLLASDEHGIALLTINPTRTLLTLVFKGELYLSRRMGINFTQLSNADTEQKQDIFEKITIELQRSLDHIDRQYRFVHLAKLVLMPPAPELIALTTYLADFLHLPIEILDLSSVFDFSKTVELQQPDMQIRYQMCLGSALRHEEKNL